MLRLQCRSAVRQLSASPTGRPRDCGIHRINSLRRKIACLSVADPEFSVWISDVSPAGQGAATIRRTDSRNLAASLPKP
jgi:hypothetical protein